MRFSFVGDLTFNTKADAKVPAIRTLSEKGISINASVVATKNNRAYVEAFGWKNDKIQKTDVDGNKIEIRWEDRKDPDIVNKVAWYNKKVIVLDEDHRYEFISDYDFCKFIEKHIDDFNGRRFLVTGKTSEDFYNGKESKRFPIGALYLLDEDDERKNKLEINPTVVFFRSKDIDCTNFKDEKRILINGYTEEYVESKHLGLNAGEKDRYKNARYIPQQFVFDCSKVDLDNEKQVKQMIFKLKMLGLKYKDGEVTCKLMSSKYYANEMKILFINGAQDIGDGEEITLDMLTETQREQIELGLASIKDFAVKGRSYGNRIVEYRITGFTTQGEYQDGVVELADTIEEFEDKIFDIQNQKASDDKLPFDDDDEDEEEDDDDDESFDMPKPKTNKSSAKNDDDDNNEDDNDEDEEEEVVVKPKKSTKKQSSKTTTKQKSKKTEEDPEEDESQYDKVDVNDDNDDDDWEDIWSNK